jgi:GntR family transcriptional regulator
LGQELNCNLNLRGKILEEMRTGVFAKADRLPRETVLSEQMGISRTQLRDALTDLEREGFISRRHGVGTVINRHVLDVKSRMDIETEFLDIVRANGYEPSILELDVSETTANALEASKLSIEEGTDIIRIKLLCGADGRPAIYCEDVLEKRLVKEEYKVQDYHVIVFQFLEKFCKIEAYMDLTELHPAVADERLAEILKVPVGTLLMNMEEVDYDIEGNSIFYSRQYFVDELIHHTVLRKKF